jgi:hypothetical protein
MVQHSHYRKDAPHQRPQLGDLKPPSLSPERKDTLTSMYVRIDTFGKLLRKAHDTFRAAQQKTPGSDDARADIHEAKEDLNRGLHELRLITELINVDPDYEYQLAAPIHRATQHIARIKRISDRVGASTRTDNYARILDTLARACPRTSHELENSLWVPLKEALDPAKDSDTKTLSRITE